MTAREPTRIVYKHRSLTLEMFSTFLFIIFALSEMSCDNVSDERVPVEYVYGHWTVDISEVMGVELKRKELSSISLRLREDYSFVATEIPAGVLGNGSGITKDYTGTWATYYKSFQTATVTYLALYPSEVGNEEMSEFVTRVRYHKKDFRIDSQVVAGAIGGIIPMKRQTSD